LDAFEGNVLEEHPTRDEQNEEGEPYPIEYRHGDRRSASNPAPCTPATASLPARADRTRRAESYDRVRVAPASATAPRLTSASPRAGPRCRGGRPTENSGCLLVCRLRRTSKKQRSRELFSLICAEEASAPRAMPVAPGLLRPRAHAQLQL